MITEEEIREWRTKIREATFDVLMEKKTIIPHAFFIADGATKYMATELVGLNYQIHRSIIADLCYRYDVYGYMVIGLADFALSAELTTEELQEEIKNAGSVAKHKDAKKGIMILYENRYLTRNSVYEFIESNGDIVINPEPAMDSIPYNSSYAGILNTSANITVLMN
jgi:hypothetical protein